MNILGLVKGILHKRKELDIKKLPSQGLFYNDDFKIFIKKADIEDIREYESNFMKDVGVIISKINKIVFKNTLFSSGYSYNDIKSIDILYTFLEIVKYTNKKSIKVSYYDESKNKESNIEFNSKYFNYFKINEELKKMYNDKEKCFDIFGYKYTMPSVGVENSLASYLIKKSKQDIDIDKYNNYCYDFTYFVGNKNKLSFNEVENLIEVFNYDIEGSEMDKISKIIKKFEPLQIYSLTNGEEKIDLNAKIDLSKIWD